jgi:hypothetical protein
LFNDASFLTCCRTLSGSVTVLSIDQDGPPSLQHICRTVIRKLVPTPHLPALPIPKGLQRYLAYRSCHVGMDIDFDADGQDRKVGLFGYCFMPTYTEAY